MRRSGKAPKSIYMNAEDQLKRINEKLQEMVKKFEFLQKENDKLREELMPAKQREVNFLDQIEMLEQKVMVLKTSMGSMNESDKKELDKKLHSYLKEIDRCITMLSD
jgi:regulator of replication initiation timing